LACISFFTSSFLSSSFFFFSAISFFFFSLHSFVFNSSGILSTLSQYSLSSSLSISSALSKSLDIFLSNHSISLFLFFDAFA
jgi:hypothetical protein